MEIIILLHSHLLPWCYQLYLSQCFTLGKSDYYHFDGSLKTGILFCISTDLQTIYSVLIQEKLAKHRAGNLWEETSLPAPFVLGIDLHASWVRGIVSTPWWSQCTNRCHRPLQGLLFSLSLLSNMRGVTLPEWPPLDFPVERISPRTYLL